MSSHPGTQEHLEHNKTTQLAPPQTLKKAGVIAIAQSMLGIAFAAFLIIREISGLHDESLVYETKANDLTHTGVGYGTALFFIIVFGVVIIAAAMMIKGKRWGRGPVLMLELLLLPISYYMCTGGQIIAGIITALSALIALALLFSAPTLQWLAHTTRSAQ
ncbi:hypothetical protein EML15_06240 [Corynebacterium sp. sy017]|uniref:hypothetical protein n=1 Tax=unclassified Corynebacterium TaxID=2624378 RepID=UPI001185BAA5|nr:MULTISPECIES: hypothetical protein [unclassified Corynebacterium]MBP3088749.1 hypothetical protein [Corynebacterium sp. sy017]QDZ42142.1 hypothetical protein FQV43_02360 [Corynebacterium sp. sy039]TSD92030.1 hypothetical protein ELY17_06240 [Corynebacterium sp. SY003]